MRFGRVVQAVDWHTAGEPLRLITSGLPPLTGSTMLERRRRLAEAHDDVRRLLMREPRGHRDMYGAVLTSPVTPEADFGILFMHNEGYSTMCGHGIIAAASHVVAHHLVPVREPVTTVVFDTPAGLVRAEVEVRVDRGEVRPLSVGMHNVPAFVLAKDLTLSLAKPGVDRVVVDIAFGGAFYAFVDAGALGLELVPEQAAQLIDIGMAIKTAAAAATDVVHPEEPGLHGIYGTIFYGQPRAGGTARNVTVFADGQIDRSPTGTGTSARLALLAATGRIAEGEVLRNESIIDTVFEGRVVGTTRVGRLEAVHTEVRGSAYVTGYHTFVLDADDPVGEGFLV
ncbi:MAG TPA: proline racemase family protein [Bacillota bacterium]